MRSTGSLQRTLTKVFLQVDDARPCLEANFVMGVSSISALDILTRRGSSPKDVTMSSNFKSAYPEPNNNLDIVAACKVPVSNAKIIFQSSYKRVFQRQTRMDQFRHFGGKTVLRSPFFWCCLHKSEAWNRDLCIHLTYHMSRKDFLNVIQGH
jgi:hypothetical protein